jgi:hypothetical protein
MEVLRKSLITSRYCNHATAVKLATRPSKLPSLIVQFDLEFLFPDLNALPQHHLIAMDELLAPPAGRVGVGVSYSAVGLGLTVPVANQFVLLLAVLPKQPVRVLPLEPHQAPPEEPPVL